MDAALLVQGGDHLLGARGIPGRPVRDQCGDIVMDERGLHLQRREKTRSDHLREVRLIDALNDFREQHEIAAERLYVVEAQIIEGKKKATQVAVPFSLDVR